MAEQLHKRFGDEEVKSLLGRYIAKEIDGRHIQQMLNIRERRFFELLKEYKADPTNFSIQYSRSSSNWRISKAIEKNILK